MKHSLDKRQLELELNDRRVTVPWEYVDLRSLTKCGKLFIRKELPAGGPIRDAAQLTLFLKGNPYGK